MKGKILNDGDPVIFEERKCTFLTCCECGLTHLLMLGQVKGEYMIYVYRDDKLTEESRQEIKAKKAKKKKEKK